ncbi:hypothetical protein PENTCL1PPCAC_30524, partial [Pristionchus entomophagus]
PARKKSEHVARRLVSLLKLVSTLSNCVPSNHGPVSDRGNRREPASAACFQSCPTEYKNEERQQRTFL